MSRKESRILTDKFDRAIRDNDIEKAITLLNNKKTDVSYEKGFAGLYCAEYGRVEIFEAIYKSRRVRLREFGDELLLAACGGDYFDIVDVLLNKIKLDPTINNNKAITDAVLRYEESQNEDLEDINRRKKFNKRLKIKEDHISLEKTLKLLWSKKSVRDSLDLCTKRKIMQVTSIMQDKISSF